MSEIQRTCKDCGKPFTISESEAKWFHSKSVKGRDGIEEPMHLPKRCKDCRMKKKQSGNGRTGEP